MEHLTECSLEAYSLGNIDGDVPIEEHLLICAECRARLEALDVYHHNIKDALRASRAKTALRPLTTTLGA